MFKFKNIIFIKSAYSKKDWINDDIKEFCFIGKSNVGKSSFINYLTNNNKIAKVSQTPGKTKLLNFFAINNNNFRIVDTPGYGFSKNSNNEKISFAKMMEEYLTMRTNLLFVVLLLDLRRVPNDNDIEIFNFLKKNNIKIVIIGTKLDKIKKNEISKNIKIIKNKLNFSDDNFLTVSSFKKIGRDDCWELFDRLLRKDNDGKNFQS